MDIKIELIQNFVTDLIKTVLEDTNFQASEIADTTAISALSEIKAIYFVIITLKTACFCVIL